MVSLIVDAQEAPPLPVNEKVDRTTRNRIEDTSSKAPQFKGTLWKLNNDGNAQERKLRECLGA
ncbi:unnamed protein product [Cladocopium goreaui]|uniref:1,4-alpha-glucan-branching enzyme 2-1, chloroplastic/amyloplastic n=1 Tax=Cladocopium goreaui TaxID=2562237 RepID=A0A9P1CFX7_9DINO|nr:unnamed protein product [Cladocopium goreaui]